jgi:hypothetical protein
MRLSPSHCAGTAVRPQGAIPDLKGTWFGKGNVIILGGYTHHPGVPLDNPPAVRDIEMTLEWQNERLAWAGLRRRTLTPRNLPTEVRTPCGEEPTARRFHHLCLDAKRNELKRAFCSSFSEL